MGALTMICGVARLGAAATMLAAACASAAEPVTVTSDGKPIHAAREVATWMIGRFFGVNEGMDGHYVQLDISRVGHVIASIDRQIAFTGQIEDDRLTVDGTEFRLTQTDEGMRTQQIGDDSNIVYYIRE